MTVSEGQNSGSTKSEGLTTFCVVVICVQVETGTRLVLSACLGFAKTYEQGTLFSLRGVRHDLRIGDAIQAFLGFAKTETRTGFVLSARVGFAT